MNHDIEKALDNLEKRAQDIQHYMNEKSNPPAMLGRME